MPTISLSLSGLTIYSLFLSTSLLFPQFQRTAQPPDSLSMHMQKNLHPSPYSLPPYLSSMARSL